MKISICILTRNRPDFLEICVNKLLEKIFYKNDGEIIILGDGHNEQTEKVFEKYEKMPSITVIRNKKHTGLNGYKTLFKKSKGDYIFEIDDDVLDFPIHFDKTMIEYFEQYSDYGFLALNVIQNEFTNGAKPDNTHYKDDVRDGKIIQQGPAGGWCSSFRRRDYRKIHILFNVTNLSMKKSQDGVLTALFQRYLKLKKGVLKNEVCFHACGPYYAKKYGYLEKEIEKYQNNNLPSFVEHYKTFRDK